MADEQSSHSELNLSVRNSILQSIKESVAKEKASLIGVGGLAATLNDLAATDLYSKGPVGDNYAKNTKREIFDPSDVMRAVDNIRDVLKRGV
jgi:hypothetical protein